MKKILIISLLGVMFVLSGCQKEVQVQKTTQQLLSERNIMNVDNEYKKLYIDSTFSIDKSERTNLQKDVRLQDGFSYKVTSISETSATDNRISDNNKIVAIKVSVTNNMDKDFTPKPYLYRLIDNTDVIKPIIFNVKEETNKLQPNDTKEYTLLFEVNKDLKECQIGLIDGFDSKNINYYISDNKEVIKNEK